MRSFSYSSFDKTDVDITTKRFIGLVLVIAWFRVQLMINFASGT